MGSPDRPSSFTNSLINSSSFSSSSILPIDAQRIADVSSAMNKSIAIALGGGGGADIMSGMPPIGGGGGADCIMYALPPLGAGAGGRHDIACPPGGIGGPEFMATEKRGG